MKLSQSPVGKELTIESVELPTALKTRLKNLGLFFGEKVKIIRFSPLDNMLEISSGGFFLAIRRETADRIIVKESDKSGENRQ